MEKKVPVAADAVRSKAFAEGSRVGMLLPQDSLRRNLFRENVPGKVAVNSLTGAVIQGYAHETSPNTPILAGATRGADAEANLLNPSTDFSTRTLEPASLGRLAQGATGWTAWRREEEVVAK